MIGKLFAATLMLAGVFIGTTAYVDGVPNRMAFATIVFLGGVWLLVRRSR